MRAAIARQLSESVESVAWKKHGWAGGIGELGSDDFVAAARPDVDQFSQVCIGYENLVGEQYEYRVRSVAQRSRRECDAAADTVFRVFVHDEKRALLSRASRDSLPLGTDNQQGSIAENGGGGSGRSLYQGFTVKRCELLR